MDDIINPLNPQELQDLVSESAQAESKPNPVPAQAQNPQPVPARPMARPLARPVARYPINPSPMPAASTPVQPVAQAPPLSRPVQLPATRLATQKTLPKGIFIVGGLALFNLLVTFFSGRTNFLYTVAVVLELVAVGALFSQLEQARKVAWGTQFFNVALIILAIFNLIMIQSKIGQLTSQYTAAINQAGNAVSAQQELTIDNLNTQINGQRQKVGKHVALYYVRDALSLLVCAGAIWYLAQPETKAAFR